MNYEDLVKRLRDGTKIPPLAELMNEAADAIEFMALLFKLGEANEGA